MRLRLVSVVVALILAALVWPADLMGQKEAKAGLSLRQKVESEIRNLEKNLEKNRGPSHSFLLIEKAEKGIRVLRKQNARQAEADEVYFDQLEAILAGIPRHKNFKAADCKDYETSLVSHFEPTFEGTARNPALKTGLKVLSELCQVK